VAQGEWDYERDEWGFFTYYACLQSSNLGMKLLVLYILQPPTPKTDNHHVIYS
jgi:hypothetical protein